MKENLNFLDICAITVKPAGGCRIVYALMCGGGSPKVDAYSYYTCQGVNGHWQPVNMKIWNEMCGRFQPKRGIDECLLSSMSG